jgi:hypothetical protein
MKSLLLILPLLGVLAAPALADYYVAGDFQAWDAGDPNYVMSDMGGGIYSLTVTPAVGFHEFKVTDGTWGWSFPGSGNSWLITDDGSITITFDTNTYADGWTNATNRIGLDEVPTAWTAVGDWQGWDNANAATAMSDLGGGIYFYEQDFLTPGTYQYKAVNTGSWNAIGADARSVNADNYAFDITASNNHGKFWVDAYNGTIKVEITPEPASLALMLLGVGLLRRR